MDGAARRRPRAVRVAVHRARRAHGDAARGRAARAARRARGTGLRHQRAGHRDALRHALRRPLPAHDDLVAEPPLRHDPGGVVVVALHAERDDGRRGRARAVVLLYQGWSYWVFRQRLSAEDFAPTRNPIDAVRGDARPPTGDGRRAARRPPAPALEPARPRPPGRHGRARAARRPRSSSPRPRSSRAW